MNIDPRIKKYFDRYGRLRCFPTDDCEKKLCLQYIAENLCDGIIYDSYDLDVALNKLNKLNANNRIMTALLYYGYLKSDIKMTAYWKPIKKEESEKM